MSQFAKPLFLLSAAVLMSVALVGQANSAPHCRSLGESVCSESQSCRWVNGYKRKDGVVVKAYCRTSSKQKTAKTAMATSASDKN